MAPSIAVSEETARSGYQAVTDLGYEGDISIDDFSIRDGACAVNTASLEVTPPPLTDAGKSKLLQDQVERYRKILRRRQRLRNRLHGKTSDNDEGDDDDGARTRLLYLVLENMAGNVTKIVRPVRNSNPGHLAFRASALPTELTGPPHNFSPNLTKFGP
ncbi:hypothetical protein DPMN_163434 [Dreissena polymorpha]|uniref:Uncharacterized protein n=1 Tax=Dreissena polymorpha TaxID=45954 RepID=A0A9D4IUK3_DREPO|nr:hypothetical protein DPMN_163434 [Dreissena polymorpha]